MGKGHENKTKADLILELAKEKGVIRARDLESYGIPRVYLQRLCRKGVLGRTERGLYTLSSADVTENHTLAQVCKRIPHGVICLLTALRFHEIGTQMPREVWLAISRKARKPRTPSLPIHILRYSGEALNAGVEEHIIEGVRVPVYSPGKTVADCFKYRNKVGLDIALEALRDSWRGRRCTMDELWQFAKVCRVTNVMRPYLEGLVA